MSPTIRSGILLLVGVLFFLFACDSNEPGSILLHYT